MDDYTVRVIKVSETRQLDTRNQPQRAILFSYMVGDHGPFTLTATPQEVETGQAKQNIQAFADQVRRTAS